MSNSSKLARDGLLCIIVLATLTFRCYSKWDARISLLCSKKAKARRATATWLRWLVSNGYGFPSPTARIPNVKCMIVCWMRCQNFRNFSKTAIPFSSIARQAYIAQAWSRMPSSAGMAWTAIKQRESSLKRGKKLLKE